MRKKRIVKNHVFIKFMRYMILILIVPFIISMVLYGRLTAHIHNQMYMNHVNAFGKCFSKDGKCISEYGENSHLLYRKYRHYKLYHGWWEWSENAYLYDTGAEGIAGNENRR